DARAADGGVEVGCRGVLPKGKRQGFELLFEWRGGVVVRAGYAAAVEVDGRERLQHVVELRGGEVDGNVGVAADVAGMLKIADTVFVERDAGDGEGSGVVRHGMRGGCLGDDNRGRFLGGESGDDEEQSGVRGESHEGLPLGYGVRRESPL